MTARASLARAAFSLVALSAAACHDGIRSLGLGPEPASGAGGESGDALGTAGKSAGGAPGAAGSVGRAGASGASSAGASSAGNASNGGSSGNGGRSGGAGASGEPQPAALTRLSVTNDGAEVRSASAFPQVSANGRIVVFQSLAEDLVAPDTNGQWDVFAHDRASARTVRLSSDAQGNAGDATSWTPSLSPDGTSACFVSWATNLAPRVVPNLSLVYQTGDLNQLDALAPGVRLVTPASANQSANGCAASRGGTLVAYESRASNLIPATTTPGGVFLFRAAEGVTERARIEPGGGAPELDPMAGNAPRLSADGAVLAVDVIEATGIQNVYAKDLQSGVAVPVAIGLNGAPPDGPSGQVRLSADGRRAAFISLASNLVPDDRNGVMDVFVRDFDAGTLARASVASDGTEGNGPAEELALSGDGRWVVFRSSATNLAAGASHGPHAVFLRDLERGTTVELPLAQDPGGPDRQVGDFSLSHDGRILVFASQASNLVVGDVNGEFDIFALDIDALDIDVLDVDTLP